MFLQSDAYQATGCYNLLCSGFIQTNNRIAIGAAISPVSSYKGGQFDISLLIWKVICLFNISKLFYFILKFEITILYIITLCRILIRYPIWQGHSSVTIRTIARHVLKLNCPLTIYKLNFSWR